MEKLRAAYRYLKAKYELLNVRKYTTVAGMLVFFLIMSIVPLSFWVSLIVGRLPIDTQEILSLPIFDSIKNVLLYVQKEAVEATTGASIILIFTTLYSATNLFYQMRRTPFLNSSRWKELYQKNRANHRILREFHCPPNTLLSLPYPLCY